MVGVGVWGGIPPLACLRPAELHKYYVSLGTQYLYLLLYLGDHIFVLSSLPPISNAEWKDWSLLRHVFGDLVNQLKVAELSFAVWSCDCGDSSRALRTKPRSPRFLLSSSSSFFFFFQGHQ